MQTLGTYSRTDWPIPDHKKLIDFTPALHISYVRWPSKAVDDGAYRGEEIDNYTAMTFLASWNETLNFCAANWNGKHNTGVSLYMPHLMLDLPVMRASTVYNWREGPILTRGKDGTIRRNKVVSQTKGFPFGG